MRPQETIAQIVSAVQEADGLPDNIRFFGYEPNIDTEPIKLPLVEVVTTDEIRVDDHNSDFQCFIKDDNGNTVGVRYEVLYQLSLEVNTWTAQGSQYDPNELSDSVYRELYQYDSSGPALTLHDEIWRFRLGDGAPDENFGTSPTLRQWSQEVDVWVYDTYTTDATYIESVDYPASGEFGNVQSVVGDIDNG